MFVELLDLDEPVDWSTVHYQVTPAWDSLVHMALVARLEEAIGAPLSDDEITDLVDYDTALALLRARGAILDAADSSDAPGTAEIS